MESKVRSGFMKVFVTQLLLISVILVLTSCGTSAASTSSTFGIQGLKSTTSSFTSTATTTATTKKATESSAPTTSKVSTSSTVKATTSATSARATTTKVSVSTTTKQTTISGSGSYIGNVSSLKFHRLTCKTLPEPQNRIYFKTRDEAIKAGYVPCKNCDP